MRERYKELRRRRKIKKERNREKRKSIQKALLEKKRSVELRPHEKTEHRPVTKNVSFRTPNIDWSAIQTTVDLVKNLPDGTKAKKVWAHIPEIVREDILMQASQLIKSGLFVGPGDWDGSLKEALLIMNRGRIPSGFRNFLNTHGLERFT